MLVLDLLQRAEAPLLDVREAPPAVLPLHGQVLERVQLPRLQLREGFLDDAPDGVLGGERLALVFALRPERGAELTLRLRRGFW